MPPLLLGIESSCDETAAAVVEGGCHVRSSVIATNPPIIAPAPRPVTRDAHRAAAPADSATRPRGVTIPGSLEEAPTRG